MKYTAKFNQSLTVITLLFVSLAVLQAQKTTQTEQNSSIRIESRENQIGIDWKPVNKCTVAKTAKRDREFDCLKGNVHIVQSEFAGLVKKDGQYVKDSVSQERTITYDRQGNKTESLVYGFDYNRNKKVDSRVVYNFNSKGIATGWEDYADGKPIPTKSVYTLDSKENRIKEVVTQADGYVRAILSLIYDSKGNNIERIYDDKNAGTNRYKQIDEYDEKNLIQSLSYNKAGSITNKRILTYENGNIKEAAGYALDANNELIRVNRNSYRYDATGNMIERIIYNKDDSIQTKYIYGYDEKGNIISIIVYGSDEKLLGKVSITLEFDSQGNWIKHIYNYSNGAEGINSRESHSIESRTITYY